MQLLRGSHPDEAQNILDVIKQDLDRRDNFIDDGPLPLDLSINDMKNFDDAMDDFFDAIRTFYFVGLLNLNVGVYSHSA